MFLGFLKKWSFNLCLKNYYVNSPTSGPSANCSKLSDTTNQSHQNMCFLKDVFVSKQKISYLLDFDQIVYIYIYIMKIYRTSFLKNFKSVITKVLIRSFRNEEPFFQSVSLQCDFYYLAGDNTWYICFGQFAIYFSIFYSDLDTKLSRHNQNAVELKHYTGVVLDMVWNIPVHEFKSTIYLIYNFQSHSLPRQALV